MKRSKDEFRRKNSKLSLGMITICLIFTQSISAAEAELPERERFEAGQVVENCVTKSTEKNACVYYKNPVFTAGQKIPRGYGYRVTTFMRSLMAGGNPTLSFAGDMSPLQVYNVDIPSRTLANKTYRMANFLNKGLESSTRSKNNSWKFPTKGSEDAVSSVDVNAYYWLNRQATILEDLIGTFYSENKKIRVDANAVTMPSYKTTRTGEIELNRAGKPVIELAPFMSNAAWLPYFNTIVMGITREGRAYGLDATVLAHEAGHGMMQFATNGEFNVRSKKDVICANKRGLCSSSVKGSPRALGEGIGDIFSFMLFPERAIRKEYITNSLEGDSHCGGVTRSADKAKVQGLKAQDFYNSCRRAEMAGQVHSMGTIYSTIWMSLFKVAKERGGSALEEKAQQLFLEHLKSLTSKDDFITAKKVAQTIDQRIFKGEFTKDLNAQYVAMGL